MRIQKLDENSRKNLLEDLLKRSPNNYGQYEQGVTEILANVKANGDQALFEYTKKFDQADLNAGNIKVTDAEIEANRHNAEHYVDLLRSQLNTPNL